MSIKGPTPSTAEGIETTQVTDVLPDYNDRCGSYQGGEPGYLEMNKRLLFPEGDELRQVETPNAIYGLGIGGHVQAVKVKPFEIAQEEDTKRRGGMGGSVYKVTAKDGRVATFFEGDSSNVPNLEIHGLGIKVRVVNPYILTKMENAKTNHDHQFLINALINTAIPVNPNGGEQLPTE